MDKSFAVPIDQLTPGSGPSAYRDPDCPLPLFNALRRLGQTAPLLVTERKDGLLLVCGHRRVVGLRQLNADEVWVKRVDVPRDLDVLRISVFDNSSGTGFNELERVRIVFALSADYGLSSECIASEWLPTLGLAETTKLVKLYASLGSQCILHPGLRSGIISPGLARAILRFPAQEMPFLMEILEKSGLSFSSKKELLTLSDELKRRDGSSIEALAGTERGMGLLHKRRALRYPETTRRRELLNRVREKTPGWLSLKETRREGLEAKFAFSGKDELKDKAQEMIRLCEDAEVAETIEQF